ncbi:MAG: hypothetical protein ACI8QF_002693 [Limisphaerales bacterium]|jgi:hypothetical protein
MSESETQQTKPEGTSDGRAYSRLLLSTRDDGEVWTQSDLAGLWRHWLNSPIQLGRASPEKHTDTADGVDRKMATLREAFHSRSATVHQLHLLKDFAKRNLRSESPVLPAPILQAVYYLCLAVAKLRHGQSITRLSNSQVSVGVEWAIGQQWLDDESVKILEQWRNHARTDSDANP